MKPLLLPKSVPYTSCILKAVFFWNPLDFHLLQWQDMTNTTVKCSEEKRIRRKTQHTISHSLFILILMLSLWHTELQLCLETLYVLITSISLYMEMQMAV